MGSKESLPKKNTILYSRNILPKDDNSIPKCDKIIWIDKIIKNNFYTLQLFKSELTSYKNNIFGFVCVNTALNFIKSHNNFNFIYILVSGSLSDEFIDKYKTIMYSLKVILSIIIYCYRIFSTGIFINRRLLFEAKSNYK